ncbi:MAG: folate-binding protein [Kiloniellaceae bacterium]
MAKATAVLLDYRGLLKVSGADKREFLQGIVSNDVNRATPETAIWTAFLTPQGKFLHEFFLAGMDETLLIDCEAERAADLARRLKLYKLRAQVVIEAADDMAVVACFGGDALDRLELPDAPGRARALGGGLVFVDPRLAALGARAILPGNSAREVIAEAGFTLGALDDYDALRLAAGVPDGSRDLEVEKSTLMESGFDELHGIDWDKGCYMGQELTARTRYRGLTKKRLLPIEIDGPAPAPGTAILRGAKEVGSLRSAVGTGGGASRGLALLRLDALEAGDMPLTAGAAEVTPRKPDWLKI